MDAFNAFFRYGGMKVIKIAAGKFYQVLRIFKEEGKICIELFLWNFTKKMFNDV